LSHRALGFGVGGAFLAMNVAFERLLTNLGPQNILLVPGLADFSPALNRGVSFSLFTQNTDTGRYLLMALLSVISIGVAIMVWQAQSRLTAAGFGLILGGALGNLLDRGFYGGVFDFLALHVGAMPLFVCNLADVAISAGVVFLAADALLPKPRSI
jgi:lipoprotein signal peptidase